MFKTLKNVYCNPKTNWVQHTDVSSVIVMKWLLMNDKVLPKLYHLDKYTFNLESKYMLALIASRLQPKLQKTPYVKYIKASKDITEKYFFILPQIQKYMNMSDNEFKTVQKFIILELEKDLKHWFDFFGVEEKYYKKFNLTLRKVGKVKEVKGLNLFF